MAAGLCLVAVSFLGAGFPLLVVGAALMSYGAVRSSQRRQ